MQVKHVPPKTPSGKQQIKDQLKGKKTLSAQDQTQLLLQMAKDLGYID